MLALARISRWWTETWQAPRSARLLYVAMAAGFAAMAVIGAIGGDALVATIAGIAAVVTMALAVLIPRLSSVTSAAQSGSWEKK